MDDVADCAQECWVQALIGLQRFQYRARFDVWLFRVAVNAVAQYGRRLQRQQRVHCSFETSASIAGGNLSEETVLVNDLLNRLPPGMRSVVALWCTGFQHSEIARILDISEGTSKSQLSKARQKLVRWTEE